MIKENYLKKIVQILYTHKPRIRTSITSYHVVCNKSVVQETPAWPNLLLIWHWLHWLIFLYFRYLAISRPFKYHDIMSPRRGKILVVLVWVISFLICFPPLLGWNERGKSGQVESGGVRWGQVESGGVRWGQVESDWVRWSQVGSGWVRWSKVGSDMGQVRSGRVR